jgi:uncharacterized membrane protein
LTATFRRRVDNVILRWQGRLDGDQADRIAPWVVAIVLFLVLNGLALAQARSLEPSADLAAYRQAAWAIRHGLEPTLTVTTGSNVFATQGSFIFYPLAWLTRYVPTIPLLLTVQSAALALAVVSIWRVCRRLAFLRTGASLMVLLVYALHPTIQSLNLDGFHPETLAVPFLVGAGYFGLSQHWRRFALCCLIAMLCRADLGLAVAGLGVLIMVQGHRKRGAITLVVGLVWAFGFLLWVQPRLGGDVSQLQAYAAFGDTPLQILWGMLTHPVDLFTQVFSRSNFALLVYLFAPVLFLPFLSPRYLMPVVPLQVIYLAGDVTMATRYGPQSVAIIAFIFLATPRGLSRLGRRSVEKVSIDRRVLITMGVAAASFFLLLAPSSTYDRPWDWGGQDAADGARIDAADSLNRDLRVRATDSMLVQLAERADLRPLDLGRPDDPAPDVAEVTRGVDAIVIDRRDSSGEDAYRERILELQIAQRGFTVQSDAEDIVVFTRPPDQS